MRSPTSTRAATEEAMVGAVEVTEARGRNVRDPNTRAS
jgi:hypothetical protein